MGIGGRGVSPIRNSGSECQLVAAAAVPVARGRARKRRKAVGTVKHCNTYAPRSYPSELLPRTSQLAKRIAASPFKFVSSQSLDPYVLGLRETSRKITGPSILFPLRCILFPSVYCFISFRFSELLQFWQNVTALANFCSNDFAV